MGKNRNKNKGGGLWKDADEANEVAKAQIGNAPGTVYVNGTPIKYTGPGQTLPPAGPGASKLPPPCVHTGEKPTISLFDGKLLLSGAKGPQLKYTPDTKLIIDCAGFVDTTNEDLQDWYKAEAARKKWLKRGPASLLESVMPDPMPKPDPGLPPPPVLELDWPDREEPRVPIDWWYKLLDVLKKDYAGHIIVACIGSHGRTGTALAAMCLAANEKLGVEDTIKFVRKQHCYKAVESWDQVDYLMQFRPDECSPFLQSGAIKGGYMAD